MEPWEDCRKKRFVSKNNFKDPCLDVILEGNGDAPAAEDEVGVKDSEVECEHVSGENI